jgi:hypothetical protein
LQIMLTATQAEARAESPRTRRARPPLSPKQRYQEYLLQRIEDYKNSVARDALLHLGDDATREIQDASEGQYFLTEVVLAETVDRLIIKRLGIPSFSKWKLNQAKLRQAQQAPTHWGLDRYSALTTMLARLEPGDHAVVVGGGAEAAVYLLSAHDVRVTCLVGDNPTCTRIESKMAAESLTGQFEAFVAMLGNWFPTIELPVHVVVIDAGTLQSLPTRRRYSLMAKLQDVTVPGGLHAVIPGDGGGPVESWALLYPEWEGVQLPARAHRRGAKRDSTPGILLTRPLPKHTQEASTA